MKSFIILLLIAFLPVVSFAQGAGGQVRRPAKKQETANTPPKIKQTSNEENSAKRKAVKPKPSKPSSEAIIQRLINNMVYVEGGSFTMGATSEQGNEVFYDEKPAHQIYISSFYIGKFEVTQEEWEAVMGNNPSELKGPKFPVENVSWSDCRQFLRKLNSVTGKNFRMLTEAEWEYAARGGQKSRGYKYSGSNILEDVGWCLSNAAINTREVGQLDPNELGIYDMSGNVKEWCLDLYGDYDPGAQNNPSGPSSGSERVFRGGSFISPVTNCRVSCRNKDVSAYFDSDLGLRLAL